METCIQKIKEEIKLHAEALMVIGTKLRLPKDRVQMCQWLRKLTELGHNKVSEMVLQLEYLQYLRVTLMGEFTILTKPFNNPPTEDLVPLAECLANLTVAENPDAPRAGKIEPILCHKSEDNRAFMCIKRNEHNEIMCYMCVAPTPMEI